MHDNFQTRRISRRTLIKLVGASGATLALASMGQVGADSDDASFRPNAYLEISEHEGVVLWLKKAEMGQQILTATAMMMADELGADLETITVKQADTHPRFGFVGTGGSFAIPGRWLYMRPLFASARAMLLRAAADTWTVPVTELAADRGMITHASSGKSAKIEMFAARASTYEVPEDIPLKDRKDFRYMGRNRVRLDVDEVLSGTARYGVDARVPGMRFAVMARSGRRDGKLVSFNRQAALGVRGVQEVIAVDDKVAVIATNSWAAMRGRDALNAKWDAGRYADVTDQTMREQLLAAFDGDSFDVRTEGTVPAQDTPLVDVQYEMPMAQHAALEPVNATAEVKDGRCTIWAPIQMATLAQQEVARELGIEQQDVTVHTTLLGGAFGRKLERDYIIEAAQIAARTTGPVQLLLTREDDMTEGGVRPPSVHRLKFWQDNRGPSMAHDYATFSVFSQQDPDQLEHKGYDWTSALGAVDVPYRFAALDVRQRDVVSHAVRLNWWRGTHHNHNAFATECALDEFAQALGEDPFDLRLRLLSADTEVETMPGDVSVISAGRMKALLQRLRQEVEAEHMPGKGRAIGIACHSYTGVYTYAAHAVEVSVEAGEIRIHRVWAAVDCGFAVSPDSVKAQMEGSVVFGLTSALWGETRVENGRIADENFDRCRLMHMGEAPDVRVILIENDENPGGMGEPPLPSVTPAFLNAVARAGGPRIRRLPIGNQLQEA